MLPESELLRIRGEVDSLRTSELYSFLGAEVEAIESAEGRVFPIAHLGAEDCDIRRTLKAEAFVREFRTQLRSAICGNHDVRGGEDEYARDRERVYDKFYLVLCSAIATVLPGWAVAAPLIGAIAMLVIRSGVKAFCEGLESA